MIHIASVRMDEEVEREVLKVIQSGQLAQGPKVEEFKRRSAGYLGTNMQWLSTAGRLPCTSRYWRLVSSRVTR